MQERAHHLESTEALSAAEWRQIVQSATETAIITLTLDGKVTTWSEGARRILGWSESEMLGQSLARLFDDPGHLDRELHDAFERGRGGGEEGWRLRKDGSRIWAAGEITPIYAANRKISGFVKILRDRSKQRDAQEAVLDERRALEILNRAGSQLAMETDLSRLVQIVTDAGVELCRAEFGAFFYNVLDDNGESYMLYALSGAPIEAFAKFPMPRNTDVFAPTFNGEGIVRSDDITRDPRYGRNAPRKGMPEGHLPVRSYLAVPVISRTGDVLGGLFFGHAAPGVFGERSERGMEGLAAEAAIAIDNARLSQATQREVAERRCAEEALRAANVALQENEERLRLATENADVGFWDVDHVNDILHWPQLVKGMFGISADKPVSMQDFYEGLHPQDRDPVSKAYAAAADPERRALYDVEYRTIGKEDGIIRWVAAKGRGIFDTSGRCVRVLGTAIDITERKTRESRLKELNETLERRVSEVIAERKLLADLVEGTDAFVQVVDLDFRWLAINKASADEFERIFGRRPRVGQRMLDLLDHVPTEREAVRSVWARALAGEQFTEIGTFGDPTRVRRHYEMKYNILRDGSGQQIGAYQFVYDVTERVREQERLARAEEQLRHVQKMEAMGQLTGGVAHDFNNLLTPIVGALDALQRKGVGGEREQRLIYGAVQSAERAKTLVQRLLAFARRQPLQVSAIDVSGLIESMGELIESTTGPQVKVIVEVAKDLPAARADANQVEMALLNLAVNARDAMPGGGLLRIGAELQVVGPGDAKLDPGKYIRLSVADTGVGMDEAVLARAVEPFFSTKGIGKGTGLGLSMVHGLASQLGGALTIQSRKGLGTNVELWLPATEEQVQVSEERQVVASLKGELGTALLVDDEDLVRVATADMLSDLGYAVIMASSAEEAIRLLRDGIRPQLLVTDHLMRGLNGIELARWVGAESPGVKVLLISGYAESEGVPPGLPRLTKPFRRDELAAKLESMASGSLDERAAGEIKAGASDPKNSLAAASSMRS